MAIGEAAAPLLVLLCAVATASASLQGLAVEPSEVAYGRVLSFLKKGWAADPSFPLLVVRGNHSELSQIQTKRALVIALLGSSPPARRNVSAGQPFLRISDVHLGIQSRNLSLGDLLPVAAINTGSQWIEGARSRPLTAFSLGVTRLRQGTGTAVHGPFAVWDVSSGEILLDEQLVMTIAALPFSLTSLPDKFATALLHRISRLIPHSADDGTNQVDLPALYLTAARTAVVAAVAYTVPVWFCIACPIVLGFLAPFLFNTGLGAAAEMICQHYQLPTEQCNDLWYGAFGMALIFSLASVLPIIYICQLTKCARQG